MANTEDLRNQGRTVISRPHFVMAAVLSSILISSAFAMIPANQGAYAVMGGSEKGSEGNGDKGKSKNASNTTSSDTETKSKRHNTTDANPGKGKKSEYTGSTNTTEYVKAQKLKSHSLNETVAWPYSEYTAYTLEANGTAKGIGNGTASESEAEIAVDMSVWNTKKNLVSMDIENGTISIDGNLMEFYSGQAHYLPNKGKMLLVGFVIVGEGAEETGLPVENQTTTNLNQTSTGNQTSTEIPPAEETTEVVEDEANSPSLRHVKLWIKVTGEGESIPSEESAESSTTVEVLSPQSKVASMWFLQMEGEMYYSTS
jgi:hypothetical protein